MDGGWVHAPWSICISLANLNDADCRQDRQHGRVRDRTSRHGRHPSCVSPTARQTLKAGAAKRVAKKAAKKVAKTAKKAVKADTAANRQKATTRKNYCATIL